MSKFQQGDFNPLTGARDRGPQWYGPQPRRPNYTVAQAPTKPALSLDPSGYLARLLAEPRVTRSLRRAILAVVQGAKTPRRDRLERSVERRLRDLKIAPPR